MAGRKGEKFWADAVSRAINRRLEDIEGKPKKLEAVANKLVDMAMDGDMAAIKEVGDRLDGRPKQATEVSGPDGSSIPVSVVFNIKGVSDADT